MPEASISFRAFVAVGVPPELLDRIDTEAKRLAAQCDPHTVRWVRPEQCHLTLRFFGNVPSEQRDALTSALRRAAAGVAPFSLTVRGLGCFPSPERARVIWLGVEGDLAALTQLQERVVQETAAFGSDLEERDFHPHLTLGRVKAFGPSLRRLGEIIQSTEVGTLGSWEVKGIALTQSRLSSSGSIYTALAEVPLAEGRP